MFFDYFKCIRANQPAWFLILAIIITILTGSYMIANPLHGDVILGVHLMNAIVVVTMTFAALLKESFYFFKK